MDKHLAKTARTFVKNVGTHIKRVLIGRESLRAAARGVAGDANRVKRAAKGARAPGSHRQAAEYVESGRKAYNEKDYERAEELFRRAIIEDPEYALAHTYLGSALYQLQRLREASLMWTKAIELDPESDAARKAERHLRRVKMRKDQVIENIERSIRGD